jgi:ankyrin repeat protein
MHAASRGDVDTMVACVAHINGGSSLITDRDSAGYTALFLAATEGHFEVADYLLSNGAIDVINAVNPLIHPG